MSNYWQLLSMTILTTCEGSNNMQAVKPKIKLSIDIVFALILQADQDQVMGFQQVFLLKNLDNKWVCTNDMFRLALHNFGA